MKLKILFATSILVMSQLSLAALCPDGTYVSGSTCTLAPDGSYVGGSRSTLCPDGWKQ
jgi:hypothetical protein